MEYRAISDSCILMHYTDKELSEEGFTKAALQTDKRAMQAFAQMVVSDINELDCTMLKNSADVLIMDSRNGVIAKVDGVHLNEDDDESDYNEEEYDEEDDYDEDNEDDSLINDPAFAEGVQKISEIIEKATHDLETNGWLITFRTENTEDLVLIARLLNGRVKKSILYKMNDRYYISCKVPGKAEEIKKLFAKASELNGLLIKREFLPMLREHGTVIFKRDAVKNILIYYGDRI